MKGFYGSSVHDEQPEDYSEYKERVTSKYKDDMNSLINRIKDSSLLEKDKVSLVKEIGYIIAKRIVLKID